MATDAAILTAARNHAAAIAAVKLADAIVIRLADEHRMAAIVAEERRKFARECERTLVQLAAQKPTEPAELPVKENFLNRTEVEQSPAPTVNPSPGQQRRRERVRA